MLALAALTVHAQSPVSVYVARDGDDAADGSEDRPFATLERARDEARLRKADGPVTIFVREGVYSLPRTLQLGPQDSGTADAPIVWRSYPGESVTLSGGAPISGFTRWKGAIRVADASAFLKAPFRQMFYDGKRQILARYPNYTPENPYYGGWAYVDGKLVPLYTDIPGESKRILQYKEGDAREWAYPEDGEVFIFPRYNWWNNIVRIESIDRLSRWITLNRDCSYAIRPGDRYYVQGMFEELDSPGEWFFDTRDGKLYFWPPEGERAPADMTVYAANLRTILSLAAGTAYVSFRGFTFEHSSGTAITLNNTTRCLIAGNVIRNVGDYSGSGISISGGTGNGAVGNDIYEVGSNAIALSGGDRITLTPAENYAENNYIHHTGVFYKQGVGISISGCGNRASYNYIHDTPRFAVLFSGNNLAIEYNHMRHMNLETSDTGAVYTGGRDWISSRGTVIRYNYMHDSIGFGFENGQWVTPYYSWGVYLDDNAGGVDVIGNIVVRAFRGLIHLHNGRDNWIENNIFVDGRLQQAEFNGWTESSTNWKTHYPTMIAGYNSVKDQPAWQSMRNIHIGPEQAVLPGGLIMAGNVFRRNIVYSSDGISKLFGSRNLPLDHNVWSDNLYWNAGKPFTISLSGTPSSVDFTTWQSKGPDERSLIADPLFLDPGSDDYRLSDDSPAWKLGFQRIPVEEIGPYEDPLRASWPIVEADGAREHATVTRPASAKTARSAAVPAR